MDPKTLDRLTIVYRKSIEVLVKTGEKDNKWAVEIRALLALDGPNDQLDTALTLSAINMAIWQRQDRLRLMSNSGMSDLDSYHKEAGQLAFDLLKLNDWRNELAFPGEKLKS